MSPTAGRTSRRYWDYDVPQFKRARLSLTSYPAAVSRSDSPSHAPEADLLQDERPPEPDGSTSSTFDQRLAELDDAIAVLQPHLRETLISTRRIINPLLDVWDVAHSIDPEVSSLVEQLLSTTITRNLITPSELASTLDRIRVAALQATMVLAVPVIA